MNSKNNGLHNIIIIIILLTMFMVYVYGQSHHDMVIARVHPVHLMNAD